MSTSSPSSNAATAEELQINSLPSFIRTAYDQYISKLDLADDYMKYKALESVYAATVKYVGTIFALIAADHGPDIHLDTWSKIFRSSSLGGWIQAADAVCANSKHLPDPIKSFCDLYSVYHNHPSRNLLERVTGHLNAVLDQFGRIGYRATTLKSLGILRALDCAVTIRNRCAHGALDSIFFKRIEEDYAKALKLLLSLIPFSDFIFWGTYGSNSLELVEYPPKQRARTPETHFWVESHLLSSGKTRQIPFLVYREDSRGVFFLNERVDLDNPTSEYIDYASGSVISREIILSLPTRTTRLTRPPRPRNYTEHTWILDSALQWREISLTKASVESCEEEVGVYLFATHVQLGGRDMEVVLYVGKTTNLRDRLRSYLRIKRQYDDSRPEIAYMFSVYGESVTLLFSPASGDHISRIERAIYETTMPEYNIIAPSTI